VIIEEGDLVHYGILRKSGRYPWGSGSTTLSRSRSFLETITALSKEGMSDPEIARAFSSAEHPFTTTDLRALKSIARAEKHSADVGQAVKLKEKGLSNVAVGKKMGIPESSVRGLLAANEKDKQDILKTTADMLKSNVDSKGYIDIGSGVENHIGVSSTRLNTAVARLKEEGYVVHHLKVTQVGTGQQTNIKVLAAPGTSYTEISRNRDRIQQLQMVSDNGGRSYLRTDQPPKPISSSRVGIVYKEDGGSKADGVIYVRPGVEDINLGQGRYSQVRVLVDGTHYLKGMAIYKDGLPDGVDLQFNTNKSDTGRKHDAMKKVSDDPENPFGATVRQVTDPKTGKVKSVMNLVNEEGDWDKWSRTLSSQFLSKQPSSLAKQQLDLTFENRKNELDQIMKLTNPAVRKRLLDSFADDADSAAVHLKAAKLPRQASKVILPVNTMKENEIYAPTFRNGERVVLIRHPHGGKFELPELTVNNRQPDAKKLLGDTEDAVGIHHKVAERLSGADFDGDSVIVVPNTHGSVKSSPALEGLKGFDPQTQYKEYPGMKPMSTRTKGIEMGKISNLITDMTIRGANSSELAAAVRHSMVVIDAEKHNLDWRRSARENGIPALSEKYQGRKGGGSSTLISRAKSRIDVPDRKPRSVTRGGPVDPVTGELRYEPTGKLTPSGKQKVFKSKKLAETTDAHSLSSGTPIEKIYGDYSNNMKALANSARKASLSTKPTPYSPSAKLHYAKEVTSLNAKLNLVLRNRPLERQAQLVANVAIAAKRRANPDMDDADLKKLRFRELDNARKSVGAEALRVDITPTEWQAIQAGAITTNLLTQILQKSDLKQVRQYATPRTPTVMTSTKLSRAKSMLASGYTQQEVADQLGVALSTLTSSIKK